MREVAKHAACVVIGALSEWLFKMAGGLVEDVGSTVVENPRMDTTMYRLMPFPDDPKHSGWYTPILLPGGRLAYLKEM